jgi:hypothetical protein
MSVEFVPGSMLWPFNPHAKSHLFTFSASSVSEYQDNEPSALSESVDPSAILFTCCSRNIYLLLSLATYWYLRKACSDN